MSILKKRGQKGFTLVELLVVIAIIGILATLLLLQLGVARQRARDAKRIVDISQTRTAVELYFDDNATYPITATFAGLGALITPKYMTLLPVDPINDGTTFFYRYAYTGTTKYHLWSELEQKAAGALNSDSDIDSTGWTGQVGVGATETCTTAAIDCRYDVGQNQ